MDVRYSCAVLVRTQDHVFELETPVFRMRYRIGGHKVDIAGGLEILKALGAAFLSGVELSVSFPKARQTRCHHSSLGPQTDLVFPTPPISHRDYKNFIPAIHLD